MNKKDKHIRPVSRYTLLMPDGFLLCVPVYEGESSKEKIHSFIENWYKLTNENPARFDHFDIKDKCPKCGGPMRCKVENDYAYIWCKDHNCGYSKTEEGIKARDRFFEKHGIKVKWVKKEGAAVICSNAPIRKNK